MFLLTNVVVIVVIVVVVVVNVVVVGVCGGDCCLLLLLWLLVAGRWLLVAGCCGKHRTNTMFYRSFDTLLPKNVKKTSFCRCNCKKQLKAKFIGLRGQGPEEKFYFQAL